jgi:nucleoside-diphosphate-sugar epimerase
MKILVTGGLGLIGHNVVQRLEAKEHKVIITDTRTNYGIIPQAELDYLMSERLKKISGNNIYHIDITDADNFDSFPVFSSSFRLLRATYG